MVGLVATTKTISLTEQIVVEERVVRYSAGSWGYVDVRFRKWIVLSLIELGLWPLIADRAAFGNGQPSQYGPSEYGLCHTDPLGYGLESFVATGPLPLAEPMVLFLYKVSRE